MQEALRRGEITQGHARALLPLGDEREQIEFCERIKREGLNVRQTEALVQETIDAADREPLAVVERREGRSSNVARAQERAHRRAGAAVPHGVGHERCKITHNARGRGKLVVQFRNHEEFERLKKHICGGRQSGGQRLGPSYGCIIPVLA